MNKLSSWRFWLPFFFQSILILIAPIQTIYTQLSQQEAVIEMRGSAFSQNSKVAR